MVISGRGLKQQGILWLTGGGSIDPTIRLDNLAERIGIRATWIVYADLKPSSPVTGKKNLTYVPVQDISPVRDALVRNALRDNIVSAGRDRGGLDELMKTEGAPYDRLNAIVTLSETIDDSMIAAYSEALNQLSRSAEAVHVVFVCLVSGPSSSGLVDRALVTLKLHGNELREERQLQWRPFYHHYLGVIPREPGKAAQTQNRGQLFATLRHIDRIYRREYLGEAKATFRLNHVFLVNQLFQFGTDFEDGDVDMGIHFLQTVTNNISQLDIDEWKQAGGNSSTGG